MCIRCGSFSARLRPGGALCDDCSEKARVAEGRRAELASRIPEGGYIVGPQVLVCMWCDAPFEAAHAGQKYCSASHRAKAWRAQQRAAA